MCSKRLDDFNAINEIMILDLPTILERRRNHALEHATLHILARKYKDQNMAGHSNPTGFFLFGDMSTDDIRNAITEAMSRLRAGESGLAVHPGCGTNLATEFTQIFGKRYSILFFSVCSVAY